MLSGKHSGRLEVSDHPTSTGEFVECTKIERTLVDIVVRPTYAGGVYEAKMAYKTAASRMSVNTLLMVLRKLDHAYPYHQAIGFLMERAGFADKQLSKLEAIGFRWDFYLDYGMKEPEYDRRWRLYHPQGM